MNLLGRLGCSGRLVDGKRAIAALEPQKALLLLEESRAALGKKPKLPALRELVALALEVATPPAIDLALAWSAQVTLRTKPTAHARRALLVRVLGRLPSMAADDAERLLGHLVLRTTEGADADDVTLAFLTAVIDDARLPDHSRYLAAHHLAHHAFPLEGEPRAPFVEALAARAHLGVVDKRHSVRALLLGEPAQAYEELAPLYRERDVHHVHTDEDGVEIDMGPSTWRDFIAGQLDAGADPRWVDEALRLAEVDAPVAAMTLGRLGTERAREELLQWADAPALDQRAVLALLGLGIAEDPRATPLVLQWLERSDGDAYVAALLDTLRRTATADDVGRLQALIARRPDRAAEIEQVIDELHASRRNGG